PTKEAKKMDKQQKQPNNTKQVATKDKKKKKNNKMNKKDKRQQQQAQQEVKTVKKETPDHIVYHDTLTVSELAEKLNKDVSEIIKKLMFLGVMANKNQDLDDDTVELICSDFNVTVEKEIILEDTDFDKYRKEDKEK